MTTRRRRLDLGAILLGVTLAIVGGYYMLTNTFGFSLGEINWDAIWPILVIVVGVGISARAFSRHEVEEPRT